MKAYVLINGRVSKTRDLIPKLRKIEGIKAADACWGRPDIFTLVQVPNETALADTVLAKIQSIDGVESTDTHIVIE